MPDFDSYLGTEEVVTGRLKLVKNMAKFMEDLGQPTSGFFAVIGSSVIIVETIRDDAHGIGTPPPHYHRWRGSLRSYMFTDATPQHQHNRGQHIAPFKAHHPTRKAIIADELESVDICIQKHDASLLQLSNRLVQSGLIEGKMYGALPSSPVE